MKKIHLYFHWVLTLGNFLAALSGLGDNPGWLLNAVVFVYLGWQIYKYDWLRNPLKL